MNKTGIYVRVSTREQATENHFSIPEQIRKLKDYCSAKDWIYKVYTDPGYSGSTLERPGLQALLNDISKGNINTVLVYKLDRLSRSQKDTLYLIEDIFMTNNISFVSLQENFDTSTAFGRAAVGILSCFAQLEREQIRERSLMGREAKAKEGYFHGGCNAPIGYTYVPGGELIINDYEAMQVREVYKLYLEGLSIYKVFKTMKDKNYTTQYGGYTTESTIRSILESPVYAGWIPWKGRLFKGRHIPLVSQETFDKVQARRNETRKSNQHRHTPFSHTTLLGGFLWCGHCGARYYCKQQNSKRAGGETAVLKYYKCYSRGKTNKKYILDPNCQSKTFRVENLDNYILEQIRKIALEPSIILKLKTQHNDLTVPNKIETIEKRVSEIKKQISKLMDLYSLDNISFEDVSNKLKPLSEEKNSLEVELEKLKSENKPDLELEETYKILKSVPDILNSNSLQEKRNMLESLIHKIVIIDDDINIQWKFL